MLKPKKKGRGRKPTIRAITIALPQDPPAPSIPVKKPDIKWGRGGHLPKVRRKPSQAVIAVERSMPWFWGAVALVFVAYKFLM